MSHSRDGADEMEDITGHVPDINGFLDFISEEEETSDDEWDLGDSHLTPALSRVIHPIIQQCPIGLARDLAEMYLGTRNSGLVFEPYAAIEETCPGVGDFVPPIRLTPTSSTDEVTASINHVASQAQQMYPSARLHTTPPNLLPRRRRRMRNFSTSSARHEAPIASSLTQHQAQFASSLAPHHPLMPAFSSQQSDQTSSPPFNMAGPRRGIWMSPNRSRRIANPNAARGEPQSPSRRLRSYLGSPPRSNHHSIPPPIFASGPSSQRQPSHGLVATTDSDSDPMQMAFLDDFIQSEQQRKRRRPTLPLASSFPRQNRQIHETIQTLNQLSGPLSGPVFQGSSLTAITEALDNSMGGQRPYMDMGTEAYRSAYQYLRKTGMNVSSEHDLSIPSVSIGHKYVFYLSEMYPKSLNIFKRNQLNAIFRLKGQVPLAVCARMGRRAPTIYYGSFKSTPVHQAEDLPLGPGRRGWPADRLPVEVFELIAAHLPRESVKNMRLVNPEFERKTSNRLFHTVVVPFRSEIYGMMTHQEEGKRKRKNKGKGKASTLASEPEEPKMIHDGMKVFQAWGPHIKRFAMAFEVDETTLESAPKKGRFEQHNAWWGKYRWPHPHYSRYEVVENLEKKADEFKCMTEALSYLQRSKELGLSLDSGLGWLAGPDMSDRHRLLLEKPKVFGRKHNVPDARRTDNERIWEEMSGTLWADNSTISQNNGFVEVNVNIVRGQKRLSNPNQDHPLIFEGKDLQHVSTEMNAAEQGTYSTSGLAGLNKNHTATHFAFATLRPNDLSVAQQEWLLENEWAQRAFLSSFCMALSDNQRAFQHVHTLVISKLSSRYINALEREDFWSAVPNLTHLTLQVCPDWRNVYKSDAGLVHVSPIKPSAASTQFYKLLRDHVSQLKLASLTVGFVGGGEHQVGIFGRNKAILPAPLTDYSQESAILNFPGPHLPLLLPKVAHLTLKNCWLTPAALRRFVLSHSRTMTHLHLNSVSLTAPTTSPVPDTTPVFDISEGTFSDPQAAPRRGDPATGNLFTTHRRGGSVPDPAEDGWITRGLPYGSWGHVIDAITPGPTTNFLRFAFAYHDDPPSPPAHHTSIETIKFTSCGYVRLPNYKDFVQNGVGNTSDTLPSFLVRRASELYGIMMASGDALLGQIVTSLGENEREVFRTAFPMRLDRGAWDEAGWGERAWECREDGQPDGGSGRFSGSVGKLVVPNSG